MNGKKTCFSKKEERLFAELEKSRQDPAFKRALHEFIRKTTS